MAKLNIQEYDLTIAAMNKALEEYTDEKIYEIKIEKHRNSHHIGASTIGHECWRKLFYKYRNAETKTILAQGHKAIEDGHVQEAIMAWRLRLLSYLELITQDENGNQIKIELLLGHFTGYLDGMIKGILEAPKTRHVWEHKSINEKKFNELKKLRNELGEKNALEKWDIEYYAQAQIYMHETKTIRHYLTVSTPGGRDHISIRTEYNKKFAEELIIKAQSIIFDNDILPEPLSTKPEFYKCKWCEFNDICHNGYFPLVHCKTCIYSKPVKDGERFCLQEEANIPERFLNTGCPHHIYIPALIQLPVYRFGDNYCIYKYNDFYICNINDIGFPKVTDLHMELFTSKNLRDEKKCLDKIIPSEIKKKKVEPKKIKKEWDK